MFQIKFYTNQVFNVSGGDASIVTWNVKPQPAMLASSLGTIFCPIMLLTLQLPVNGLGETAEDGSSASVSEPM